MNTPENILAAKKILVAENNEVNLSMLLDMLSIMKHDVFTARNGQEAIDLALLQPRTDYFGYQHAQDGRVRSDAQVAQDRSIF